MSSHPITTPHTKYIRKSKPDRRGDGFKNPETIAKAMRHRQMGLAERFWSQVEKTATCWLWKGALLASGHGQLSVRGRMRKAHHIALELVGQTALVEGMVVDHVCRVRNCVYPGHLRIVPEGVNSLENNISPWARNARKPNCKHGHPFSFENTAWLLIPGRKTRHGSPMKSNPTRSCITCWPHTANSKYRVDPPAKDAR